MNQTDFPIRTNVGQVHISLHLISCLLEADSCYGAAPILPLLGVLCPGVHSCTLPCFDTPPPLPLLRLLPSSPRRLPCCEDRRYITSGGPVEEAARWGVAGLLPARAERERRPTDRSAPNASFTGEYSTFWALYLFAKCCNAQTNKHTGGKKRKKRKEKENLLLLVCHLARTATRALCRTSWLTHERILHE